MRALRWQAFLERLTLNDIHIQTCLLLRKLLNVSDSPYLQINKNGGRKIVNIFLSTV